MTSVSLPARTRILNLALAVVSAHSLVLGLALLLAPTQTLRLVGWTYTGELFWPRQAGLFLLILGTAYAAAVRYRPLVWLVIGSKLGAFVFLLSYAVWQSVSPPLLQAAVGDGLMCLVVSTALWQEEKQSL